MSGQGSVTKIDVRKEWWDNIFAPSSALVVITTVDTEGRVNAASFGTCVRVCHDPVYISFTCGTDTTARLPTMKVPVLAINGEFDNARPTTERTAALIPGAVHKILPNTGHACCLEDPASFDALVVEFLAARGLMPQSA